MDEGFSHFDVDVDCDNTSIHTGVKEVTQLAEYVRIQLIKLSPYSPMLNPIENYSPRTLAVHRDDILQTPPGITKPEYRVDFVLRAAKYGMSTKGTPELCDSEATHTLSVHGRAMDKLDMPVGL
ncbi:Hypothetical protein PHPALM_8683 [Phytophthora palmivora]|uniref:Tc1-like transposase DDE domain-containing protein n=1 Tax=Phytophthora palmivora TaxID=4796 RepID=A0A2P4Y986_9STRA|nr:Hypothetical protein PHPALM_8683 [Phytophthora palmivora]